MRQKMNLIRALVTEPKVLFLDEPTIGMDPHIARRVRRFIAQWVRDFPDRTVLLTTHYMAEAEELCRTVAIIDQGAIVVADTPENLRRELGGTGLYRLTLADGFVDPAVLGSLPGLCDLEENARDAEGAVREFTFHLGAGGEIGAVLDLCRARGARIVSFKKDQPCLEDLFVRIVGRRLAHEE
jgi:ABC-2 type transport system ATP-binding protein